MNETPALSEDEAVKVAAFGMDKPEPIRTYEALNQLPTRSVVLDFEQDAWQKLEGQDRWACADDPHLELSVMDFAPFEVIWVPEVS